MMRDSDNRGSDRPTTACPADACDAHMHIYDRRFTATEAKAVVDGATAGDYRQIQQRLGTRRTVVVQPRAYGTDNRVTLDAILALGADNTRGIAVLTPDVSDAELETLQAGGIRGIRFTLYTAAQAVVGFDMVEPLAHRVHALGWHVQLHWTAAQLVAHADLLKRLPCPIVFDHLARLPLPEGLAHPAAALVSGLLQEGRAWVKLSGPYLDSRLAEHGEAGAYADTDAIASHWAAIAPDRVLWGSDWPHVTEPDPKPDDAALFDLLARWVPDDSARRRVLVDNPATLYGFNTPGGV